MLLARCSWLLAHPAGWLARGWLVRVTGVREDPDALGELSPSSRLGDGASRRRLSSPWGCLDAAGRLVPPVSSGGSGEGASSAGLAASSKLSDLLTPGHT